MNFIHYITAILMSLEPSHGDGESWTERSARMDVVAHAIADASSKATCTEEYATADCKKTWLKDKKSLAVLLVTTGYWESRFARNVHEGNCAKHECDAHRVGSIVHHRARSPWQIQKTGIVSENEYKMMNTSTLEGTTMAATVATRYIASGVATCSSVSGAFAIYTGIHNCNSTRASRRASFYENLMGKSEAQLEKAIEKQRTKLEERLTSK